MQRRTPHKSQPVPTKSHYGRIELTIAVDNGIVFLLECLSTVGSELGDLLLQRCCAFFCNARKNTRYYQTW